MHGRAIFAGIVVLTLTFCLKPEEEGGLRRRYEALVATLHESLEEAARASTNRRKLQFQAVCGGLLRILNRVFGITRISVRAIWAATMFSVASALLAVAAGMGTFWFLLDRISASPTFQKSLEEHPLRDPAAIANKSPCRYSPSNVARG